MRKFLGALLAVCSFIFFPVLNPAQAFLGFLSNPLKKEIERAGFKAEDGRRGEDDWYLKVSSKYGITLSEFCDKIPLLRKNKVYAMERIAEFGKIKGIGLNLKRRVFLVPLDAADPPPKRKSGKVKFGYRLPGEGGANASPFFMGDFLKFFRRDGCK